MQIFSALEVTLFRIQYGSGCVTLVEYRNRFDVRGSVHHSIIHKENPTRCNSVLKFLFHVYMKLNMFRATYRPSSGA